MLKKVIPSYLYLQYSDDEDLRAFVSSYNVMSQEYIDWFNNINLPIYTQPQISGGLLDWVGAGLYGISRATILQPSTNIKTALPNTFKPNTITPNAFNNLTPYQLTDDIYKRVITWHFYKGDGKVFSLAWLKRRINRFLFGSNGIDYRGASYRVSVTFTSAYNVLIRIINISVRSLAGSFPNKFKPNNFSTKLNTASYEITYYPKLPDSEILKKLIDSGLLELPFQFTYTVSI